MSSTVEQIKDRLTIVDVISSYLKLEKSGKNYKARCPFHAERTPSFFVSPDRDTFHCFGCDKGGDIFTFVENIEGVDFAGALEILADKAGVRIERRDPKEASEKARLISVMDEASRFFEEELAKRAPVGAYLAGRGLIPETVSAFRVGYAPEEWRSVSAHLLTKGFSEHDMERAGLIVRNENNSSAGSRYYDRFRGRIMFPLFDTNGKIIAFSGRIFGQAPKESPKYLNSPETALFNKSKTLFPFHMAKSAIREKGHAILVEGQFDVILAHQAGFANTIASSGTALTAEHINLISRMTENLIFAFDSDDAGLNASERGVALALEGGLNPNLALLPYGVDPADLIAKDKTGWEKAVREAKHIVDFYIESLRARGLDDREFRKRVGEKVLPFVAKIKSKIDQAHFVSRIAVALALPEEPIWEELKIILLKEQSVLSGAKRDSSAPRRRETSPFEEREKKIEERVIGLLLWQEKLPKPVLDIAEAHTAFEEAFGEPFKLRREKLPQEVLQRALFEAEMHYADSDAVKDEVEELFRNMKETVLRGRLVKALNDLRYAEMKKDERLIAEALKTCNDISQELNRFTEAKIEALR